MADSEVHAREPTLRVLRPPTCPSRRRYREVIVRRRRSTCSWSAGGAAATVCGRDGATGRAQLARWAVVVVGLCVVVVEVVVGWFCVLGEVVVGVLAACFSNRLPLRTSFESADSLGGCIAGWDLDTLAARCEVATEFFVQSVVSVLTDWATVAGGLGGSSACSVGGAGGGFAVIRDNVTVGGGGATD